MPNIKNIIVTKDVLSPSQGKHTILPEMFTWRTEKKFVGENKIVVVDPLEAAWWNRPLATEAFCKKEADGVYSYNLPFLHKDNNNLLFKTNYNVLLNKNSVCIVVHIQLDSTWTEEQKLLLSKMLRCCIEDALAALGVKKEDLSHNGNDLYFRGIKFSGEEQLFEGDVFTQATVITLEVVPEKDIFARLTGKYAFKKPITGISEEAPSVTKEALIEALIKNINMYINQYFC
jgi:hypothetical protein